MNDHFNDLLERLVGAGVDFVVVGGFAGVVHGCTYVTQDIDICCDFSAENLMALQEAVSDLHPVHRMTPARKALALTEQSAGQLKNLYLDTDIGQLDCLSFIDGLGDYEKVKQASKEVQVRKMLLRVLGLDGLIEAKKAMNRPQDKQALLQLETVRKLKKQ
ncbi:MAG: nucleotidyltransferase [Phycisphaerae bacterium]|nr:nucleotidyltransferase [Phycisphaerae bacterium]